MHPYFSIIIPCYNCVATIEATVQSVQCQSFKDYEVILINDGSTDETLQALERIAAGSEVPVRVFSQANAGVSCARNYGIEVSQGQYLLFLDADDLLAENLLEVLAQALYTEAVDTISFLRTSDENRFLPLDVDNCKIAQVDITKLIEKFTYTKRFLGFFCFAYRSTIIEKHHIRFVEGVRYGEDWEFATKYLAHCQTAKSIEWYGYFYRIVPTSVSRSISYAQTHAIEAAKRTYSYLNDMQHPFAENFGAYMYPRALFSVAHRFGKARDLILFKKLHTEYDVRDAMRRIFKNRYADKKSRLAAGLYMISPKLFYYISNL